MRGDDEVEGRKFRLVPQHPVGVLDHAATAGDRGLLHLSRGGERPHDPLFPLDYVKGKAGGKIEFAGKRAGIIEAQHGGVGSVGIEAHRDHDVIVAEPLVEDHPGQIGLVQPLHDHDDGRFCGDC